MSAAVRRVKAWQLENKLSGSEALYPHVIGGVVVTGRDLAKVVALAERAEAAENALVIIRDGRHPVGQARDVAHAALAPKPKRGRR